MSDAVPVPPRPGQPAFSAEAEARPKVQAASAEWRSRPGRTVHWLQSGGFDWGGKWQKAHHKKGLITVGHRMPELKNEQGQRRSKSPKALNLKPQPPNPENLNHPNPKMKTAHKPTINLHTQPGARNRL